jgi:hypothetical protein
MSESEWEVRSGRFDIEFSRDGILNIDAMRQFMERVWCIYTVR